MNKYLPPEAKRVLVLAPHPDDETLGCGGTIALYTSMERDVCLAVVSDGGGITLEYEDIDIVDARKQETLAASRVLGIDETHFLGFPDGALMSHREDITARVETIIRDFGPDIVFAPSPIDFHDDHRAVSEIALRILSMFPGMRVAFYEVYGTIRFNILVEISPVLSKKREAVLVYQHSLFRCPEVILDAVEGLNRFRSIYTHRKGHYEAFWVVSKPTDTTEVIQWLTYGMKREEPHQMLFPRLKAVDELIFELKNCNDMLANKDSEMLRLKASLEEGLREINRLDANLENMAGSLIWRFGMHLYKVRDKILPKGSKGRKMYNRIISRMKSHTHRES